MEKSENKQKWDKVFLIAPLFVLISFGYVLSGILGNVLFVERLGAHLLPYAYIGGAFSIAAVTLLIAGLIQKISVARLLQALALIGAAAVVANWWLMNLGYAWSYIVFLIFTQTFFIVVAGTVLWNLPIKITTPFEAKRIFAYFSLGSSVGGISAGLVSSFLSGVFGTQNLIFFIAGSLVLAFFLLFFVQKRYAENLSHKDEGAAESQIRMIKKGFQFYKSLKIARLLLWSLMLFYLVLWISDYEFQKILGENFSEARYSQVAGMVSIAENVLLVVALLFVQQRLLKKLGVMNMLFSSTGLVLIPFAVLFFLPIVAVAAAMRLASNVVNYSIFSVSGRFIITSIPRLLRDSVSVFIGGNADAGAMLLAGSGLVLMNQFFPNQWIIATAVLILCVVLFLIYLMKGEYTRQILKNLQGDDRVDMHGSIENLAEHTYGKIGVQELMKMLEWRELDSETVRKIVFSLGKIDNPHVIPGLLKVFENSDESVRFAVVEAVHSFSDLGEHLKNLPFTRLNILDVYKKFFLEGEDQDLKVFILEHLQEFDADDVIDFLKKATESTDNVIRYQAISAMKCFNDRGIVRYLEPFLQDSDVMIRASAVVALWQFQELRPGLLKNFVQIMSGVGKEDVKAALFIIAKLKINWERAYVERKLEDEDVDIAAAAALALVQIDNKKGVPFVVGNLVSKTKYSLITAKTLKYLSKSMLGTILGEVRRHNEAATKICIDNLKATYLDFSEVIASIGTPEWLKPNL